MHRKSSKLYRYIKAVFWLFSTDPAKRRRVRHELARLSASLFGDYPVGDDYMLWREDKEFLLDFRRLSPGNSFSEPRKYTLREFAKSVRDMDGAVAECGCYEGASAYFIAQVLRDTPIYLFDSFEGLSTPGSQDVDSDSSESAWRKGEMKATEEIVRENLKAFSDIQIFRGWIPERFNEVEDQLFKLVHIDVDLYQPTMDSLEFFYPRLVKRGVIVLDDYGSAKCPGARKATDEYFEKQNQFVIHLPTAQGVVIKN